MKNLKIRDIELKGNLFLAPIAGYSDVGMRKLAKKYGASFCFSEMISAKALLYQNKKTLDLLATYDGEDMVGVQLFGSDPEDFAKAVKIKELEKFDIIDINMGCPAPKIYSNGEGSALLKDINRAKEIVKAAVLNSSKPITVKFRSGIDEKHIVAVEFARAMEEAGASALTIHARTTAQGYSGKADLEIARAVKAAVKIPVIVSGDCTDKESYLKILDFTKADGVMIARGAFGRPEVFSEILGKEVTVKKLEDIFEHIDELLKHFNERFVLLSMRSHIAHYIKGQGATSEQKLELMKAENIEQVKALLCKVFGENV